MDEVSGEVGIANYYKPLCLTEHASGILSVMPLAHDPIPSNDSQKSILSNPTSGACPTDWDLVSSVEVNVLLIGERGTTGASVDAMRSHLVDPLVHIDCRDGLDLSSAPARGTVVLLDVDELALADQQRLNVWLARADDRPRVISTSRVSLVPMIDAGMFIESLYYRLNILRFDLTSGSVER